MKPAEIREKTMAEIQRMKGTLKEELFHLSVKKAAGQLEKTHRLKELKRDIARILTIEKQKGNAS